MSTQSVSRLKERGGSGGKIESLLPSKTLTLISEKPNLITSGRKSIGKENPNSNPRSISRVSGPAQKPVIRPMPRVAGIETRSRSQPRGRSASPSDFTRVLSDMRKTRVEGSNGGSRVLEKRGFVEKTGGGIRVLNKLDESGKKFGVEGVNSAKRSVSRGKFGVERCVIDDGRACKGEKLDHISKGEGFSAVFDDGRTRKVEKMDEKNVLSGSCGGSEEGVGFELSGKGSGVKIASSVKAFDEGSSSRVASKSASRLHEKLAFLEGKVKRIACDIKKTKEMLDMNNTDASKVILSDIQQKISGIEKAVGNVMADSSSHLTAVCSGVSGVLGSSSGDDIDSLCQTLLAEKKNVLADSEKVSVKGLSGQELEARLFPHHQLLRSRSLSKVLAPVSKVNGNNVLELNNVSNLGQNLLSPTEDNPIVQHFLASVDKVQAEVITTTNEVRETEEPQTSTAQESSSTLSRMQSAEVDLLTNEKFDEFDDQENKPAMNVEEEMEEGSMSQLIEVGRKTSTGGWFVSEGEAVLLAHDDGSCSFHDIVNYEEKAEYTPPPGMSQNIWRDCWIVRAPGADGCSAKYVVAASAGNTMDSGFCSWDFYCKDVRAFHIEDSTSSPRIALSPLPDNIMHRRNPLSGLMITETQQWWYRPCGPLIVSTASCQRSVKVFDIRDGEQIMKWDVQKPVLAMDYCSPLQWRNRGKVVVAEAEGLSLWDVSSLNPQPLSSVSTSGRRMSALHVNNTDAELGGGVRQRISSSEAEGNDGVFCTADSINILDFRQPSGIGLKIPKSGLNVQSVYSRGDSIFLGCNNVISAAKKQVSSQVLQFSLRKQKIVSTYNLPESNSHSHHRALTQVWGNTNLVMAVSGLGLFVFDAQKDDGLPSFVSNYNSPQDVREIIGPDDMYSPSFDYHSSQILLISRDRPAMWRQLL